MPFDPNWPPTNAELESAPFRNQFTSLKASIDALTAQVAALQEQLPPIGSIQAWEKSRANTPALGSCWAECNGQVLNLPGSPYDGQTLPDQNTAGQFLRGALASGGTGGSTTHSHNVEVGSGYDGVNVDNGGSGQSLDGNPKATTDGSSLPPFYEVVYVMRVK
jgi:hypothetical protein